MTDQDTSERTAGGLVGTIAGKAKEAAGSLTGNNDLAREGRLQQAQVDAEAVANRSAAQVKQRDAEATLRADETETEIERQRLQNEIEAQERKERIGRDRHQAERNAQTAGLQQKTEAESHREAQKSVASSAERRAERERVTAAEEPIRLEQDARHAETTAATIDHEENR